MLADLRKKLYTPKFILYTRNKISSPKHIEYLNPGSRRDLLNDRETWDGDIPNRARNLGCGIYTTKRGVVGLPSLPDMK